MTQSTHFFPSTKFNGILLRLREHWSGKITIIHPIIILNWVKRLPPW
ncbi:hypothetical protein L798_10039 [Zootermopsis nevadensis]|uniref:Uncharacterized protein n=1 Tax=Zootermopsis nevadensis TaxID=136037 RepID=A0A067R9R7_ZOONE|nr:hypothetical protein L798_10039 [Zootermopsis nevadensis]